MPKEVRVEDMVPYVGYVCVFVTGDDTEEHDQIFSYASTLDYPELKTSLLKQAAARKDAERYAQTLAQKLQCEIGKAYD